MSTLTEKINATNNMLRDSGSNAIQKIEMKDREGKVIGQIRYGYKPQYVFDAVNQIIGPENWRYELIKEEIFENQAVAEVKLFLKTDAEWLCKGSHKGQMGIVRGNVGDAQKGAITDAIQKCFSLISVGQDAYRGLLGNIYKPNSQQAPKQYPSQPKSEPKQQALPTSQPVQPAPEPTTPVTPQTLPAADLPMIDGITYQHHDSIVVAMGKVYDKKELLKASGFRWNKEQKNWFKEMTH
ncbi:MAG: hypothetical protein KJ900_05265 [Proteobacteria bacterium]|nr:hypothetical protein [Desulfocapsa sp.]MBU3944349.1 hypothetical protein [Pseudomonadota bacterium]MCG2745834.1 hypothetical protein [Desulfobacteraceae bacterium]MBU4029829.1 hypothetical protein [Pseudomonadota bacterium]MBU4042291.1 hypothetical protein [Pseudomonadota bacterium]